MTANLLSSTQSALSQGWGILGSTLGTSFTWYAASTGTNNNPISNATNSGSFTCYFDRDPDFTAKKASEYGKPEWFCAYDRGGPNVGDYLSNETDTYAIVAQDPLTPSKVVLCQAIVDFYRPGIAAPTTPDDYANYVRAAPGGFGQIIAAQWPISLLTGSRGEKAVMNLPDSGRMPWFNWLCPAIPGVVLRVDDRFQDANGFRYAISACELTSMGYRGTAQISQG